MAKTKTEYVKDHIERKKAKGITQNCIYLNEEAKQVLLNVKDDEGLKSISEAVEFIAREHANSLSYKKKRLGL